MPAEIKGVKDHRSLGNNSAK